MTVKEQLARMIEDLPDDATIEDAMQRLLYPAKIERGIQQADMGRTIPHAQVKKRMNADHG